MTGSTQGVPQIFGPGWNGAVIWATDSPQVVVGPDSNSAGDMSYTIITPAILVAFLPLIYPLLPTSPIGLPVGTPWNNGGFLCFVQP